MNARTLCKKITLGIFLTTGTLAIALGFGYIAPRKLGNAMQENCRAKLYVSNTGVHTNIVVPVSNQWYDWSQTLSLADIGRDAVENYRYLSFSWGDREVYLNTPTWSDLEFSNALKALFFPTPSVMQVKGYDRLPNYLDIKCLQINPKNYLALMNFIENSFQLDERSKPKRIAAGYNASSGFYAATGSYSLFKTCNDWTAAGLRKAEVNTPVWSGLASAVMLHLKGCECEENLAESSRLFSNSGGI